MRGKKLDHTGYSVDPLEESIAVHPKPPTPGRGKTRLGEKGFPAGREGRQVEVGASAEPGNRPARREFGATEVGAGKVAAALPRRSGEGWEESDPLRWPHGRWGKMGRRQGGVSHLGRESGVFMREGGMGSEWSLA